MTPGDRIDLIMTVKPALLGMTHSDAFLYVSQFTHEFVGSWDWWVDEHNATDEAEWCTWMLSQLKDDELQGLHDYVTTAGPSVDESKLPWHVGEFRLFLSHIAREKHFISLLATELEKYGVHGFVAHEHIDPGQEWAQVIRSCLFTCDALVAVLHDGFHESSWTDQEVGFVMGQNKFAVAVRAGIDPYGFIGAVQGISAPPMFFPPNENLETAATVLTRDIVRVLAGEPRTQTALRDALVNRLVNSQNFEMSNSAIDVLRQSPRITEAQYRLIREAQAHNSQVKGAFNVDPFLDELSSEYDEPPTIQDKPF